MAETNLNLANKADLPYSFHAATISSGTTPTVTNLADRAINTATLGSTVTAATITLPAATADRARDFYIDLTIEATSAPTLTFIDPATSTTANVAFGANSLADIAPGYNLILFTELPSYEWSVEVKHNKGSWWTNPYATDGLVAMWDGEWNAGGGEHKTTLPWVDCVNGWEMAIVQNSSSPSFSATVDTMCLRLAGAYASNATAFSSTLKALCASNPLTIEIGYTMPTDKLGTRGYICYNIWNNLGYDLYIDPPLGGLERTSHNGDFKEMATLRTRAFVFDGTTKTAYLNGTQWASATVGAASGSIGASESLLGLDNSGSDFGFYGDVYFIRIYSRALTAAEIAANYAIDAQRFGLT